MPRRVASAANRSRLRAAATTAAAGTPSTRSSSRAAAARQPVVRVEAVRTRGGERWLAPRSSVRRGEEHLSTYAHVTLVDRDELDHAELARRVRAVHPPVHTPRRESRLAG